jgi:3D (Asp-Asp-Asp) domain-containing protein
MEGKRKKIGQTASGLQAKHGTIAADTNLYPFGTVMYVPDYGWGRVEDCGSAIKGQTLDVYFRKHREALKWGRVQRDVMVWMPGASERTSLANR